MDESLSSIHNAVVDDVVAQIFKESIAAIVALVTIRKLDSSGEEMVKEYKHALLNTRATIEGNPS
jgi:hypothetical protein